MAKLELSNLFIHRKKTKAGSLTRIDEIVIDKPELVKNQRCAVAYLVYVMTRFDITRAAFKQLRNAFAEMGYDVVHVDYMQEGLGSRYENSLNGKTMTAKWKKNKKYFDKFEEYIENELYETEHFWSFYSDVVNRMPIVILYAEDQIVLEKEHTLVCIYQLVFERFAIPMTKMAGEVLALYGKPDFR